MKPFVHLNVHSEYSLRDGIVQIDPLVSRCVEFRQPAVALTDLSNLYGLVKFYRACLRTGIKPIVGCDVWVRNPCSSHPHRMVLLCQNDAGYLNLSGFLTATYLDGDASSDPQIEWETLRDQSDGLLCILDDREGPLADLSESQSDASSLEIMYGYRSIFEDRVYMAVSRVGWPQEEEFLRRAVEISLETGIPVVATNRVVYLKQEDFESHEIRVCINDKRILDDARRPRNYTAQQYLRSAEEMGDLFRDLPSALENTMEIARRCNLFLDFGTVHMPKFPGAGDESEEALLCRKAEQGLAALMGKPAIRDSGGNLLVDEVYAGRLEMELGVITKMGFSGYFLIVSDFIEWSRINGIPVGPGRGSGAGSLVAWALGITLLDPIKHDLIFERFLNPERVSLPDFDIDFCVDGRDRVIEYVSETYGKNRVAQIITFGTMAAKAVVRDVGRVLGLPYGFVDRIAKLIPFDLGMTLEKALSSEEELRTLYEEEPEVKTLIDAAMGLEGISRNVGKHAGGVVIAPRSLVEFTPLYSDDHLNQAITQFDKDDLEAIGLVKFDFLGLRTLTIIERAVALINEERAESGEDALDMNDLPLDDGKAYDLIQSGRTTAVFQLESQGMKQLIAKVLPQTFEDLTALIAMFRPGPLQSGMVDDFIDRKAGKKRIEYLHDRLEPILKSTYGVILYQEQVMKTAQTLAGYTLGGADLLRKAMGKKLPAEMAKQSEIFVSGAVERGVDKTVATDIFDLMEKFAGYGFNKSHSAAYALIAYHTAWLKAHYPAAFMAATLTTEIGNIDKVVTFLEECRLMGLEVKPPHVNESHFDFRPLDERTISYGLGSLKGVGQGFAEQLTGERITNGCYKDFFDMCQRHDAKKLNRRILESIIKSGAMDGLGPNRATLVASIPDMLGAAGKQQDDSNSGQFDLLGVKDDEFLRPEIAKLSEWPESERLACEKEALGFYQSGHPVDLYEPELSQVSDQNPGDLDLSSPKNGIFAGIVVDLRTIESRKGRIGLVTLENTRHRIELRLFPEKYREFMKKIEKDRVLIAIGEWNLNEVIDRYQLNTEKLMDMEELRNESLAGLELIWRESDLDVRSVKDLHTLLSGFREGHVPVRIHYTQHTGVAGCIALGEGWQIRPEQRLLDDLKARYGQDCIRFVYERSNLNRYYRQSRHNGNGKARHHAAAG